MTETSEGIKPSDAAQEAQVDHSTEVAPKAELQQKSKVVRPGEKRSKKGKRRNNSGVPPPLAPDDYVKVVPVSKQSEVSPIQEACLPHFWVEQSPAALFCPDKSI